MELELEDISGIIRNKKQDNVGNAVVYVNCNLILQRGRCRVCECHRGSLWQPRHCSSVQGEAEDDTLE